MRQKWINKLSKRKKVAGGAEKKLYDFSSSFPIFSNRLFGDIKVWNSGYIPHSLRLRKTNATTGPLV